MIDNFKLNEARKYLEDMIKVSREMNDLQTEANYRKYEELIIRASYQRRRIRRDDT